MIPAAAFEPPIRIVFGILASRRGAHWQLRALPADATPFGEPVDEAKLLADSLAGVMKHVPLPTRELGIVSDLTTAAIAFYTVIGMRLDMDRQIAIEVARRSQVGHSGARPAGPASEGPAARGEAAYAMEAIAGDGAPLRAQVEHEPAPDRVQTGDPIADGLQLGYAPTSELGPRDDPEPVLFEAFRPGETPARVEDLVEPGGEPLLDRVAPVIEVDGEPAARELR